MYCVYIKLGCCGPKCCRILRCYITAGSGTNYSLSSVRCSIVLCCSSQSGRSWARFVMLVPCVGTTVSHTICLLGGRFEQSLEVTKNRPHNTVLVWSLERSSFVKLCHWTGEGLVMSDAVP